MNETVNTFNDFEDEFYFYFEEIAKILKTINGDVDDLNGNVTEENLHITLYSNVDKNVKYNYPKKVKKLLIDYFETQTRFNQWVEVNVTPADKFFYSVHAPDLDSYVISVTARDDGYEPYKNNKTKRRVMESNELKQRAKKHKKKDKGLGWCMSVNPDKGNQKALDTFNNSTADGAIGEVAPMGESLEKDTVILYYENLPVEKISDVEPSTLNYPGATNYFDDAVEYEYEVDKNEVIEKLADLITSEDYPEYDTSTDEEFWKFIEDNFDSLFDKYEKELLKEFSDYAREDWEEKHQESDWENRNDPSYYESLKEASEKRRYEYNGPVYYDGRKERDNFKIFTVAESPEKAISNILWRIAMGDKQRYYRYDLDNSKLTSKELSDIAKEESNIDDEPHICDKCGIRLTDSGECPVCDYGEEDMFRESISPKEAIFRLKDLD